MTPEVTLMFSSLCSDVFLTLIHSVLISFIPSFLPAENCFLYHYIYQQTLISIDSIGILTANVFLVLLGCWDLPWYILSQVGKELQCWEAFLWGMSSIHWNLNNRKYGNKIKTFFWPWLVWLSGLSTSLPTERFLVWLPARARAWVRARSPVGSVWEATTRWCFSPSLSPSLTLSLKVNK